MGDVGDAVGAVGDVGAGGAVEVAHGDAEDFSEAEGDDGEVVAAQAEGRCADDHAEDERDDGADDDRCPEGEVDAEGGGGAAGDQGGGVGADAEEGDVSEVEETGEADDDVEAEGDGREDQDVDRDERVGVAALLDEGEGDRGGRGPDEGDLAVLPGDDAEAVLEAGLGHREGCEADGDQVGDEELRFLVIGVDAEGDDEEAEGEDAGDDEDFGPGGELLGGGCRLAGVVGELVRGEGRDERADEGDVGAGFEVDDSAEDGADREDREPGGGEVAEGQEPDGLAGAGGGEPAEALDAERGERVGGGEGGSDEGDHLEAGGAAVVGQVAGEVRGPGPREVGADDGEEAAGDDRVQERGGRGALLCRGGLRGGVGGHVLTPDP